MTPIDYLPIFTLSVGAFLTGFVAINLFQVLRPSRKTPMKRAPYECGMEPFEEATGEVPVPYYVVAMLFLLFDVEVAFLYPWIVSFSGLPRMLHLEVGLFLTVVLVGLVYAWRVGALEWEK